MATPPINLIFSKRKISTEGIADLVFGETEKESGGQEWIDEDGGNLVIKIGPPDWSSESGGNLAIYIPPKESSSGCPPDWVDEPGNNLDINFVSCETVNVEWKEESSENIDFSFYKSWVNEIEDVDFDLQSSFKAPDWKNQDSSLLDIDITCCGDGEVLRPIKGYSQTFIELETISEVEMGEYPVINGNSSTLLSITASGAGLKGIDGRGSETYIHVNVQGSGFLEKYGWGETKVEILCNSVGWKEIYGFSDLVLSISSIGTGTKEVFGDSSLIVSVDSVGTGIREIQGIANTIVDIQSEGTATANLRGDFEYVIVLDTVGDSILTGGFPIDGESKETFVRVSTYDASGLLKRAIFNTFGTVALSVGTSGTGTKDQTVEETLGHGKEIFLELISIAEIEKTDFFSQPLLLPEIFETREKIQFKVDMVVDIEKLDYEIRDIETNKEYLEFYRYDKWRDTFEVGSYVKDTIDINEQFDDYITERKTTIRKYGCSEVTLYIEIESTYEFIRNPVNIKKLIGKEIDRAILDSYALYQFEYE